MNKNDSHIFNKFETQDELFEYIKRPKEEWDEEKGQFDFEQCHFNCDVNFESVLREFDEIAHFTKATFNKNVSFKGITFRKTADFNGCTFMKETSFRETVFKGDVNMSSFDGDVNFYMTRFEADTFFWNRFEGESNFSHSKFKNPTDFSKCIFIKDVKFHDARFESEAYFNECEFISKMNAWRMTFLKNVTFKWTDFRSKANFSELKVEKGYAEFHGVNFEDNAYFYDSKIESLDLKKSVIDKGLFFLSSDIKKLKRETARIIKNEFLKQNNRIEALKIHKREMSAYLVELGQNIIKPKGVSSFFKSIADFIILIINLLSNGFGLWWFLAVLFLFVSTYLMFNWYLMNLNCTTEIDFWKYYPEFILPTHKFGFIEKSIPNNYANIIDFLGRVVASFGIYQTIQAFRKFGRF